MEQFSKPFRNVAGDLVQQNLTTNEQKVLATADDPESKLLDAQGALTPQATNSIRQLTIQLFDSIFDPATGGLRLLDQNDRPKFLGVVARADELIRSGEEPSIAAAVKRAARDLGIAVPELSLKQDIGSQGGTQARQ